MVLKALRYYGEMERNRNEALRQKVGCMQLVLRSDRVCRLGQKKVPEDSGTV
jgi:hypothetical protein